MTPLNARGINVRCGCVFVLMMQKLLVALAEFPEFNLSPIAVINILSICCHIRNTLNNMSVKRWVSFVSDGTIKNCPLLR